MVSCRFALRPAATVTKINFAELYILDAAGAGTPTTLKSSSHTVGHNVDQARDSDDNTYLETTKKDLKPVVTGSFACPTGTLTGYSIIILNRKDSGQELLAGVPWLWVVGIV